MKNSRRETREYVKKGRLLKEKMRNGKLSFKDVKLMKSYINNGINLTIEIDEKREKKRKMKNNNFLLSLGVLVVKLRKKEMNALIDIIIENERSMIDLQSVRDEENMRNKISEDVCELVRRQETSKNIEVLRHYLDLKLSLYFNETELERRELDWVLESVLINDFARFLDDELENTDLVDYLAQSIILNGLDFSMEEKKNEIKDAIEFDYLVRVKEKRIEREKNSEFENQINKLKRLIELKQVIRNDEELVRNYIKNVLERKIKYYGRWLKNKEIAIQKYNEYLDEVSLDEYIEFLNGERRDENVTKGLAEVDDKICFLNILVGGNTRINKDTKIDVFKKYLRISDARYFV